MGNEKAKTFCKSTKSGSTSAKGLQSTSFSSLRQDQKDVGRSQINRLTMKKKPAEAYLLLETMKNSTEQCSGNKQLRRQKDLGQHQSESNQGSNQRPKRIAKRLPFRDWLTRTDNLPHNLSHNCHNKMYIL